MSANFNPIMPCEKVEVYEIIAGPVTPKADPEILSAEWRENSDENDKISVLGVGEKCHIEIRTQGFDEGDELTLEIKENRDGAETLKKISAKIKENVAQTPTDGAQALSAEDDWYGKQLIVLVNSDKTDLLWAISAMNFYLDKVETADGIKFEKFSSGYRCIADNIRKGRDSTNHMGNAVDIVFSGTSGDYASRADKARELFAIYCGAHMHWNIAKNQFCLEPSLASYYVVKTIYVDDPKNPGKKIEEEIRGDDENTANTWIHIDCKTFKLISYQKGDFYCKTESGLKGSTFIDGSLVETSDSGKYKDIENCTFQAEEIEKRERGERLWLGMVQDAYLLKFSNRNSNKKWIVEHLEIPAIKKTKLDDPRIQDIVEITDEDSTRYKIIPRGKSEEGWIDKKYIHEICKYEKD